MPDDRLPKKLLFGQVKGSRPSGRPRLSFNDVASSDCHECRITRPLQGYSEQTALARQDVSCTYLAHCQLEYVLIIVIIITGKKGRRHIAEANRLVNKGITSQRETQRPHEAVDAENSMKSRLATQNTDGSLMDAGTGRNGNRVIATTSW